MTELSLKVHRAIWAALLIAVMLAFGAIIVFGQSPTLTEVESLKMENFQLKAGQLQSQMKAINDEFAKLQGEYRELNAQIEREHPGYRWNGKELARIPAPPAPTNKKK